MPFVIAMIDLDEGIRIVSDLRSCALGEVKVGMQVRVNFEPVDNEISLPFFEADRD